MLHTAGSVDTIRGRVSSSWIHDPVEDSLRLEVTIPVNSEAQILFPQNREKIQILEGGNMVWDQGTYHQGVEGITNAQEVVSNLYLYQKVVSITVGSGDYVFQLIKDR